MASLGHIGGSTAPGKFRRVHPEWIKLNAQMGDTVNTWSSRRDLIMYLGTDGGQGSSAFYNPATREIEINTIEAFGEEIDPALIGDFTLRNTHFQWPRASGFAMHEAMHAQYSTSDLAEIHRIIKDDHNAKDVIEAYEILEESRIEHRGVLKLPKNKSFLRASALTLVAIDLDKLSAPDVAMRMMALAVARVDAGVLEPEDVRDIRTALKNVITDEQHKRLRTIWLEFQSLDDDNPTDLMRLITLSREWAKIHQEVRDNNPQPEPDKPTEEQKQMMQSLMDALGQALIFTELSANKEAGAQQRKEEDEKKLLEQKARQDDRDKNQNIAGDVFTRVGTDYGLTRSKLASTRTPTLEERQMANKVAQALEKARYRDRIITKTKTARPPGRLKVGTAMQGRAVKALGGTAHVEPWTTTRRRHTEDPNLTLGIMGDISGSMKNTMPSMATATWVMQEAGARISARTAAVYYGLDVFSVLRPGERQTQVTEYTAPDSGHAFDKAFRALDGALNLLSGSGARLLIINSDGDYSEHEQEQVIKWLTRCRRRGVAVVWLGMRTGSNRSLCAKTGATYLPVGLGITQAADVIGQECTKALTAASRG